MSFSSQYSIIETLHESASTSVYRAKKLKDGSSVIVKIRKPEAKDDLSVAPFVNELQMLSLLRSDRVAKIIDSIHTPSEHVHIFEDVGGKTLYEYLQIGDFPLAEALYIAIELAKAVGYLESKNVIHTAINPKNIIYNSNNRHLHLTGFGYAVSYNKHKNLSVPLALSSENILYTAPEQTGKTLQKIDHRTDLYGLGMTLYHLFSGELPFSGSDFEELLHKNLTTPFPTLDMLGKSIPNVISAIVQKLIEKRPEYRYQSIEAVIHDLEKCQKEFSKTGSIVDFEIATIDRPSFSIGEHLYGREHELKILAQTVEKAMQPSSVRVLISGVSGIGKTRLAEEFISSLHSLQAYTFRSKFDQYRSALPYTAFRDIFEQLSTAWLSQKEEKKIPLDPDSLEVLRQTFPELRLMLSKSGVPSVRSTSDYHHQLLYAIDRLFHHLASADFMIVIFIDDLQWADQSSTELITHLLNYHDTPYLHFIGSYREVEIQRNPWAFSLITHLQKDQSQTVKLHLSPLSLEKIYLMISNVLVQDDQAVHEFASIVEKKTNGNPFYIKAFIEHLVKTEVLAYVRGKWKFSIDEVAQSTISVNMGQLIKEKFDRLEPQEKKYLQYLSLWGNRGNLKETFDAMTSFHLLNSHMKQLDKSGFIEIINGKYKFVHDQMQQFVYMTITSEMKRKIHLQIGRYLDNKDVNDERDIIAIISHLNKGYLQGKFPRKLYKMNLEAVEVMLERNAYVRALREIRWMDAHGFDGYFAQHSETLAYQFMLLKGRTLYVNREFEEVERLIKELISKAKTLDQKYQCFRLYKDTCVTTGTGYSQLLLYALELFGEFGLDVPASPSAVEQSVNALVESITSHPKYKQIKDLYDLPVLNNMTSKRVMELLVEAWEVAFYLADVKLMQWMYLTIIRHSLFYGNSSASAFGYVLYGAWLVSQGEYKKGYEFGQLALEINRRFNDALMVPKVCNFVANFISPYSKFFDKSIPLYEKSLNQSQINGDMVFGTWANFLMHFSNFFSGRSLDQLAADMVKRSSFLLNSGDQKMIQIFMYLSYTVHSLQDHHTERFEEEVMILEWEREKFFPGLAWYGIIKAQNAFLNGAYESGLRQLERHVHSQMNEVIMFPKIRFHFIRALLLLGVDMPLSEAQKRYLEDDLNFFDHLAASSPSVYRLAKLILKAEKEKKSLSLWKSSEAYDKALAESKKVGNNFYIAVVGMCASRFWQSLGYSDMAAFYQNEAIFGLNQWGAYALANSIKQGARKKSLDSHTESKEQVDFNYKTLVKSFITLSKTVDKTEVIQTLLKIIVEHATASRAVLIFKENDTFHVRADLDFKQNITQLIAYALDDYSSMPISMIRYAINSAESIIAEDPHKTGKFRYDEYIKHTEPASCIVLPAVFEGSVDGILYLENSDVSVSLSSETIKTLELLLTQAVIAFKNAVLYAESRRSAEELQRAQEISKVGSWKFNTITQEIQWSAETYRIYDMEPYSIDIDNEWFFQHLRIQDRPFIQESVEMALQEQKDYDVIHSIITNKGKEKFVHQRAKVVWDGDIKMLSGTIQDITVTKQAEELIARLSQVVNQNPFTTIITDPMGKIEYVNPQCLTMTGFFERELLGKKMSIFRSGVHSDSFYAGLWNTISKEKKLWQGTIVNRIKDGSFIDCASTIFPIFDQNHAIVNYVSIQENVTERNVKDKLFIMQTRQAQMGEMLSMIAHQWRQPLAVIGTLLNKERVNLVLNEPNVDELMKNFDDIEAQVQHLSRTISDFRDFFKPDKEMITTKNSIIVTKAVALLEHMLKQKNIMLTQTHSEDGEYETYEHEMMQVILNLVKNAQDAFEEKNINDRKIIIETTQHRGQAIITVEDNAGGISPTVAETLFLPYVTTKNEHNGTGLGLYMSKTIVEDHCKGQLTFQNTMSGVKFMIKIPLKGVHD